MFGLIVVIAVAYAQVGTFDFNNYDDNLYVTQNDHVQAGLTLDSIKWAMTAAVAANWTPVTLLSHMLDCQLFHLQGGMHHLMNVVLHMLASLMLFLMLERATGARWPSAFAAFVFALHPLHVESVAWVAERKDVLSALLFFLALYAYVYYVEHPGIRRYLLVVAAFCLGLMAKPMLVTFPFVLLLFDLWPCGTTSRPRNWRLLLEKLPLFALSATASVLTFYVQRSGEAVRAFPLPVRIENALIAYVAYLGQTFWPARLAVLYPYQTQPSVWQAGASAVLLLAISVCAIRWWRTRPYLATGWFWYLGMLVPVIGLVQVGNQSRADRYMYLPMVGLLMMIAWGAADIIARWPQTKVGFGAAAALSCAACMVVAMAQVEYWQNSGTLFQRAVDVTEGNYIAEYNLGHYLVNHFAGPQSIPHFEAALRYKPDYVQAESNLGMVMAATPGRMPDAIRHFEAAVRLQPDLIEAQYNLGLALSLVGRTSEAITHYQVVQQLQPSPEIAKTIAELRAKQK